MIIQGDNGTILKLHIKENNIPVDLSGATVEVKIKQKNNIIIKQAQITGLGECEISLTSTDVATIGNYIIQATVTYADNKKFSSDVQEFVVGKKL